MDQGETQAIVADFTPRPYQVPAFSALMSGIANRIITVWHRRAGKDMCAFNCLWIKAAQHKGNYGYFFPYATQGRQAIWYGITNEQKSFREYIPKQLIEHTHDTEMRITLTNGSTIQFIGTDNIDSKMGSNYAGVVMSEYPLQNPEAWRLIEPILKVNKGWAWFPYTPRGKENHGYTLYKAAERLAARGQPWFHQLLTVADTGLIEDSELDDIREQGTPEEFIQQEYYCNFGVSNFGAYFAEQIQVLEERGHYNSQVKWNPNLPVHTSWDLGIGDMTTIWFWQEGRYGNWHAIDYYENHSHGIEHYLHYLQGKQYYYGTHLVPHDADSREKQTGKTTTDYAFETCGVVLTVVPKTLVQTQIDATHRFLPLVHANSETCQDGLSALKNYERTWDSNAKVFRPKPNHNWASHGTDSFKTFVMGVGLIASSRDDKLPTTSDGDFDPRDY